MNKCGYRFHCGSVAYHCMRPSGHTGTHAHSTNAAVLDRLYGNGNQVSSEVLGSVPSEAPKKNASHLTTQAVTAKVTKIGERKRA